MEKLPTYIAIYEFENGWTYWVDVHTKIIYFNNPKNHRQELIQTKAFPTISFFKQRIKYIMERKAQ